AARVATARGLLRLFMIAPLKHGVDAEADQVRIAGGDAWQLLISLIIDSSVLHFQGRRGMEVIAHTDTVEVLVAVGAVHVALDKAGQESFCRKVVRVCDRWNRDAFM